MIDRWVWELPGGYIDVADAAAREVGEETGWRPQHVCLSWAADPTDAPPDLNEIAR